MATQTKVRITISADGKQMEQQVEGVKGTQCDLVTKKIEDSLGIVVNKKHTSDFYNTEERFDRLEAADWGNTCTTFGCALEPSYIEKLEEEDWR